MTMQPLDISWLCGEYSEECYSFIYIRATPEQVVARLGGRWEDFTPGPFPDDPDHYHALGSLSASPPSAIGRSFSTLTGSAPAKT
ncbi:hypothetical protein [Nonomuraea sp. NPDC049784]|uniref:hypothetical protein n=1 Tax=Nonomuraea sp. NPDC049784 TaxID=3154361 RepID=UPI0033D6EAB6